jgi:hypothetical protein
MPTEREVPEYVKANLDYWLTVELTDPDRAEPIVDAICRRWGI